MYEFQIGGKSSHDPKIKRYAVKQALSGSSGKVADVAKTSIASLGLSIEDMFGYWFDFGDDWWHQIDVISIKDKAPKGKYPKITKRVGASPPQYAE